MGCNNSKAASRNLVDSTGPGIRDRGSMSSPIPQYDLMNQNLSVSLGMQHPTVKSAMGKIKALNNIKDMQNTMSSLGQAGNAASFAVPKEDLIQDKSTLKGVTYYWYPSSSQCRAILMLMLELRVCPEHFVMIDLIKEEHKSEEFTMLNPNQTVPCLVDVSNGEKHIMWDARAILVHLVTNHGPAKHIVERLYPFRRKLRLEIDKLLIFHDEVIYPAIADYMYPIVFNGLDKSSSDLFSAQRVLKEKLQILDDALANPAFTFLYGKELTLADITMSASIVSLEILNYDFSVFPNILGWLDLVKRTANKFAEANQGLDEWKKILNSKERVFREGIAIDENGECVVPEEEEPAEEPTEDGDDGGLAVDELDANDSASNIHNQELRTS